MERPQLCEHVESCSGLVLARSVALTTHCCRWHRALDSGDTSPALSKARVAGLGSKRDLREFSTSLH